MLYSSYKFLSDFFMNDLVVKTNWINQALQNLSLIEIRIIQLAIIDARESGKGLSADKPLTISAKRYADAFNVQAKNAYANIKEAEDTLFKRQFSFIDSDGNAVKSRWVQDVKYLDAQGAIEICLTRQVVKGISRIDGAVDFFTQYLLSNTVKFKSVYSVRLYELLAQWKNADMRKIPIFELQTFRKQLGVEDDEYIRMFDFKKYVLDKAINEINKHSDLVVSYEKKKKGRVISGFKFKISEKANNEKHDFKMTDKQRFAFADKLAHYERLSGLAGSMTYKEYAQHIAEELKTDAGTSFYKPYLLELGFKM